MEDHKLKLNNTRENKRLEILKKKQFDYQTKAFYMMIQTAFIFGIPALVAIIVGKYLDTQTENKNFWTFVCLVLAFIISWTMVISRFLILDKKMRALEREIKNEKAFKTSQVSLFEG